MKTNVIEYLNDISDIYPNNIAYEEENKAITFNELKTASLNISSNLCKQNIGIKQIIGIFIPKSINAILSMFGILYSGNAYMPLDVKSPPERLLKILENVNPIAIITDKTNLDTLKVLNAKINILLVEDLLSASDNIKTNYKVVCDTEPIYILNTSGSTGTPKAVVLPHRAVLDYIEWFSDHYKVTKDDIIAGQANIYFDVSVTDIYTPLKTGCKYVLIPDNYFVFPIKLLEYLQQKLVTILNFIPVSLISIANLDLLNKCKPNNINKILFIGEPMPTKQLNYWKSYYPSALISNMYGPTEAAVQCSYYDVNRELKDDEPLPIGFPCGNTEIILLNEQNNQIKIPNIIGELCIKGSCLALGYYNNPQATSEHFVQNPLNNSYPEIIYRTGDLACYNEYGELMFKGRKDHQIKHLGLRIELSEIDTAFSNFEKFSCVCTVYDKENKQIVLFYEAKEEIPLKDIILYAKRKLPKYMIPAKFIKLDRFPLNQNGKIDRKELLKTI